MSLRKLRTARSLVLWVSAVACFAFAIALSYRAAQEPDWYTPDLRTPAVVCFNAAVAVGLATLWLRRQGASPSASARWWSVAFGLFCAGVFRLAPRY